MTNKEAIIFLSKVKQILLNDNSWLESTKTQITESFDMAIEALREIRKVESMDLIERQDALDALEKIGWIETKADKEYAIRLFTDLPSAQPKQKENTDEQT